MMRTMLKCIIVAGIWGLLQGMWLGNSMDEISLNDILLTLGFGEMYFIPSYLIELGFRMLPYIVFQILFGVFIYRHFCTASVFYFSRQANRIRWFLREAATLYVYAAIFVGVILGTAFIGASFNGRVLSNPGAWRLLAFYMAIHSLWIFITALMINILSLFWGNSIGFVTVIIIQFAFVMLLFLFDTVFSLEYGVEIHRNAKLLKINPISHLIVMWHTSRDIRTDSYIHMFSISFDLYISVLVLLIAAVIAVLFGCLCVRKKEIIAADMELEGV